MSKINDGGPAFPGQPTFAYPGGATSMIGEQGMSLRDWFAGMALGAIITADGAQYMRRDINDHAALAFDYANAMLAARSAPVSSEKEG